MSVRTDVDGTYTSPHWGDLAALAGKTQVLVSFWLKMVSAIPTASLGLCKTDFSTGGWVVTYDNASDTLGLQSFGSGAGALGSAFNAPVAGQGWLHFAMHLTTVGGNQVRVYRNGVIDNGSPSALTNELANVGNLMILSNHTGLKIAEPALYFASDSSLTPTVAQTLATALAAQTLPNATTPIANWYAPCRSDLVTVIG